MGDAFDEAFPYYLSIGMTAHQFWHEDPTLCRAYRKAEEMRTKRVNREAWLQGAYVYEALCCVSPVLHAFAESGTTPMPYLERPYPVNKAEERERQVEEMRRRAENFGLYAEGLNRKNKKNT